MTRGRFWSFAWMAAAAWMLVVMAIWHLIVPVAWVWPSTDLTYSNGYVSGSFEGYKIKGCARIPGKESGYVISENGTADDALNFEFFKDKTPDDSRPTGAHSFGIWRWQVEEKPHAVMLTMQHVCDGRIIQSQFGPFKVQ